MKTVLLALTVDTKDNFPRSHSEWEMCIYTKDCDRRTADGACAIVTLSPPGTESAPLPSGMGGRKTIIHFDDGGTIALDAPTLFEDRSGAVRALGELISVIYTEGDESGRRALAYMMEAICSLLFGDALDVQTNDGVTTLRDIIERSFADPEFRVSEVIDSLGYNKDYMRRLFKSEVGKTPTDYLTDRRIAGARRLLAQPDTRELSITKVAFMCGFYDANYFTRVFKKETGMLPSEYRRRSRQM